MAIKPVLHEVLICKSCDGQYILDGDSLRCQGCGTRVSLHDGIPLFSPVAGEIQPSEKLARSPDTGTPWRKANWKFLERQLSNLNEASLILDVGAGRGDFATALERFQSVALDIYPYPEIDLVCDLTQHNPFRPNSFDAIILMNVLEHVYDTHALLDNLVQILKPGGRLILAIPFLVKLHQTPVDFVRYTHFALQRFAPQHGFELDMMEGYYDPLFFLAEGTGNIKHAYLPVLKRNQRLLARLLLTGIQTLANGLQKLIGQGVSLPPDQIRSQVPTGYQIVYRKIHDKHSGVNFQSPYDL